MQNKSDKPDTFESARKEIENFIQDGDFSLVGFVDRISGTDNIPNPYPNKIGSLERGSRFIIWIYLLIAMTPSYFLPASIAISLPSMEALPLKVQPSPTVRAEMMPSPVTFHTPPSFRTTSTVLSPLK